MKSFVPMLLLAVAGCGHLPFETTSPAHALAPATAAAVQRDWGYQPAQVQSGASWSAYGGLELQRLIALATESASSVAEARARIADARARIAAAGARTGLDGAVNASARGQRQSENGTLPLARLGADRDQMLYQVGFDATWELDLFGGVRAGLDAAEARLGSAEAELDAVRLSLAAEVTRTWIDLNAARIEADQQWALVATLEQSLAHIRRRNSAGDVSHREVEDWIQRVAVAQAALPAIQARARAAQIALATLTGQPAEATAWLMAAPATLPERPVPAGVTRAEVISGRPDVLAAEARLRASVSDTTIARAQLYPRIAFSFGGGWQATEPGDLAAGSSLFGSFGPVLSWQLFDRGRVRAEITASDLREAAALRSWEQSVIGAINDVERAFSDVSAADSALQDWLNARNAARHADGHAARRFSAGDISRIERLDALRNLQDAELSVTRANAASLQARVALDKALGSARSH